MELIYGSPVSIASAQEEAGNGRISLFQPYIIELDGPMPQGVTMSCNIFGPEDVLEQLHAALAIEYDPEFDDCGKVLVVDGDSAVALALVKKLFPDIVELNADDDEVFARLTGI
jgi:hypothetical protein